MTIRVSKKLSAAFLGLALVLLSFPFGASGSVLAMAGASRLEHNPLSLTEASENTSLKVIVILAEFTDAKHESGAADKIEAELFPTVTDYFYEVSYGMLSLTADTTPEPILIPKPFSSYGDMVSTATADFPERMRELIADVIEAADEQVDFSQYDRVAIIFPDVELTAYALGRTSGLAVETNDDVLVTKAVVSPWPHWAFPRAFAHEIAHTLGLPDLYDYTLSQQGSIWPDIYVGPWCLMSNISRFIHFFAYCKILLGWIPPERIETVPPGSTALVLVEALEVKTEGIQVVKVPLTSRSYYLVEVRRKIGFDESLADRRLTLEGYVTSDEGVLVTYVDETIDGTDFARVQDAEPGTFLLRGATFDVRPGKENTFVDRDRNVAIVVIYRDDNTYGILVTTATSVEETSSIWAAIASSSLELLSSLSEANAIILEADRAMFKSSEAASLLTEAHNEYASAIESAKSQQYEKALQDSNRAISLVEQAFSTELLEAIARAKDAVQKAEDALQKAEVESPYAVFLVRQAENKLASAANALEAGEYEAATEWAESAIVFVDRALSHEQRYREALEVITRARHTVEKAEVQSPQAKSLSGRAEDRLTSAASALETQLYKAAMRDAESAASLVEQALSVEQEYREVVEVMAPAEDAVQGTEFKSPQAMSLAKQAEDLLASAANALEAGEYEVAVQHAEDATSLVDQAILIEQEYREVIAVMTRAESAVEKAELERRTEGLDEAKALLEQSRLASDAYDYDKAFALAVEAKDAAETATANLLRLYGWYIGAAVALVAAVIVSVFLARRRKTSRDSSQ